MVMELNDLLNVDSESAVKLGSLRTSVQSVREDLEKIKGQAGRYCREYFV